MKWFFCIAALLFVLLASACGEPTPTPEPEEQESPFLIAITDISATSARVAVFPTDKDSHYYFDLLTAEYYKIYAEQFGFQRFINGTTNTQIAASGATKEEVLDQIVSVGDDSYTFTNLTAETEYYALAFGIDRNGNITTEVISKPFKTTK